jgi:YbbR domain-containing protein
VSVEIVRRNFGLKVLAVGLAVVGWAYFRVANNPIDATQQLQQLTIPIATVNLPLGYVADLADRQATVTVVTKRGEPPIKPEQINAVLDLTNKQAGVYNVPVQLVAPDLVVQSLSPASVTLTIEPIQQRSFPITVHYTGTQTSGIVVSGIVILPNTALVRGPTSLLAQVSAVQVDVALANQPKVLDEMVRPVAVGAPGAEFSSLSVAPNLVRVKLRFITATAQAK